MTDDRPKLCVFDLDGTLVDSQHHIVAAMQAAFSAEHITPPSKAEVRQIVGLPLEHAVRRLAPTAAGLQIERIGDGYREAYFSMKQACGAAEPLMDGAMDALNQMEVEDWQLAIVTGKGRRGLLEVLDAHGIKQRFATLKSADDGPGKPDPTLLYEAMDECGVGPERAVMVGDTTFDLQMARRAKVTGIGVSWGYHSVAALEAEGARTVLKSFGDLVAVAGDSVKKE